MSLAVIVMFHDVLVDGYWSYFSLNFLLCKKNFIVENIQMWFSWLEDHFDMPWLSSTAGQGTFEKQPMKSSRTGTRSFSLSLKSVIYIYVCLEVSVR